MKRKILMVALILIAMSIGAYGTLAYYTYEDTATNVVTAGNVRISLHEWKQLPDGKLVPYENAMEMIPGGVVSKIVEVENTGRHPAWIRVSVTKAIALAEGASGEADLTVLGYNLNTDAWTERDGYFYYNVALQAGETTAPLFTKVKFAEDMSNLYQKGEATLHIQAQAVQVAHNGESVFEAAGWPSAE